MDSFKRPCVFLPLDLEIIDLVHEAAWAQIEARDPFRDPTMPDTRATFSEVGTPQIDPLVDEGTAR